MCLQLKMASNLNLFQIFMKTFSPVRSLEIKQNVWISCEECSQNKHTVPQEAVIWEVHSVKPNEDLGNLGNEGIYI